MVEAVGHPFDPTRRALTGGLLLAVTLNALAALSVVTVAPLIPADLGGLRYYGWIFSSYLLASLIGTVWGGLEADRRGVARAFGVGVVSFGVGLALAGAAPTMVVLVAARVAQGFGAAAFTTCVYVAITRAYPDAMRSTLMAYLSTAWVVPALVGPAAAGLVAQALGWRWVFLALLPPLGLVAALTLPRFVALGPVVASSQRRPSLAPAALVAAGAGVALAALSAATETTRATGTVGWLLLATVGAGAMLRGLAPLLPPGALRLARGAGAVVTARGGVFAAFVGVEAFLALALTDLHGLAPARTGLVIATGAIAWTFGAWTQARRDRGGGRHGRDDRGARVQAGILIVGLGLAAQVGALGLGDTAAGAAAVFVAIAGWATAGFGMGFAHATSSVLAFATAEREGLGSGAISSALQLGDNVGAALTTGVGGAAFAFVTASDGSLRWAVAAAFGVAAAAWGLSLAASRRFAPATPAAPGAR